MVEFVLDKISEKDSRPVAMQKTATNDSIFSRSCFHQEGGIFSASSKRLKLPNLIKKLIHGGLFSQIFFLRLLVFETYSKRICDEVSL